jgi:serine/threonine protein kinase
MANDRIGQSAPRDPSEHHSALPLNTRLGRYQIASVLGQGAFGITYRGRDQQLDRDVAIKEYLPAMLATRSDGVTVLPRSTRTAEDFAWGRARFLDEAKTIARLAHVPGIVRVYDFLEANGTAYFVMELIEGETLAERCRRETKLSQATFESILYPLLDSLEEVHAVGFLHRDIKPENIIIAPNGTPKLIDFGAARAAISDRAQTMTAVFTPAYAAPEQFESGKQGPWTDIYGMAATFYACVTGRVPLSAATRVMGDVPMEPASELRAGEYTSNLLSAIDAGLVLRAGERPQTIATWRELFRGRQQTRLEDSADTIKVESPRGTRAKRRLSSTALLVSGAAIAMTLVGGVGYWVMKPRLSAGPTQPFEALLEAALAKSMPATTRKFREETATAFVNATANRALAVAPHAGKLRYTASWPTRDLAEEKALEKCQQFYDEPCALIAVNDATLPAGADGIWPVRDAARLRYVGPFNVERIPAMRAADLQRPEVANYPTAPARKAMAFNASGIITAASGATSQRGAEEQALSACKTESLRQKIDGVCYLYAIENRVVLPLRATAAVTAETAPPAVESRPTEATVRARLLDSLAKLAPSERASARESQVTAYQSSTRHKALAIHLPSGSWRTFARQSATLAEEHVLEACQVRYGEACVLVAVNDDVIQHGDVAATRRSMPRAGYDGLFDPSKIPAADDKLRQRPDVAGYAQAEGAKAAVLHPSGRLFVVTGATSQRESEERAFSECNSDPQRNSQGGPCLLYAAGNQVVLTKRALAPVAPTSKSKE